MGQTLVGRADRRRTDCPKFVHIFRTDVVWTPVDFLDLSSRDAVDKTLQRLAQAGQLRRIDRGLYDGRGRRARANSSEAALKSPASELNSDIGCFVLPPVPMAGIC